MFKKNVFEKFVRKKITRSEAEKEDKGFREIRRNKDEEIFNFQKEKEKLVEKMHKLLKDIDEGKAVNFWEDDDIREIKQEGLILFFEENGKRKNIKLGDIAVASTWNQKIKLSSEVDRKIKKKYVLRETKRAIQKLWNHQILLASQRIKVKNKVQSLNKLKKISKKEDMDKYESISDGQIAEKMIKTFLIRLTENNPNIPFKIEEIDFYDDVEYKVDFYIRIKDKYRRAASINAKDGINRIGVQYTMNQSREVMNYKQDQIKKSKIKNSEYFDDLILISIPINNIANAINQWKKEKEKRLVSPDYFLNQEDLKKIFMAIISKIPIELDFNPEVIWEKIEI